MGFLSQKEIDKNKRDATEKAMLKLSKVALAGKYLAEARLAFGMQPDDLTGIVVWYANKILADK